MNGNFLMGTGGDDVLTLPVGMHNVRAGNGDDIVNTTAGLGQLHAYGGAGDDKINLGFGDIDGFSQGHHVHGEELRGPKLGSNTYNFVDIDNVDGVVVGRIDDFNPSRDSLQIGGRDVDLDDLPPHANILEFNGEFDDEGADPGQWLHIDTGEGDIFYALYGARIDMTGNGGSGAYASGSAEGEQEIHFIREDRVLPDGSDFDDLFESLPNVRFRDPQDYIPAGYEPDGGVMIADTDRGIDDVLREIEGGARGDLIAAGLNDDTVRARGGDDRVWGGSGHDRLMGDAGDDTIRGGPGDDLLMGGEGDDVLNGDAGLDTITGGAGENRFVFAAGNEEDIVVDFALGIDTIDLSDTGLAGFGALRQYISQDGDHTTIDIGDGDVLTLRGVEAAALRAGDFAFGDGNTMPGPVVEPKPPAATDDDVAVDPEPSDEQIEFEAVSEGIRRVAVVAGDGGLQVVSGFDVDESGRERTYDVLAVEVGGRMLEARTGAQIVELVAAVESDGDLLTDAILVGDDLGFRLGDARLVVLEDIVGELDRDALMAASVDVERSFDLLV